MDPRSGCINAQDQVKDSTFSQKGHSWVKDIFKLLLFTAHSCMYLYVMLCDLPDTHFLIKLVKFWSWSCRLWANTGTCRFTPNPILFFLCRGLRRFVTRHTVIYVEGGVTSWVLVARRLDLSGVNLDPTSRQAHISCGKTFYCTPPPNAPKRPSTTPKLWSITCTCLRRMLPGS